MGPYSLLHQSKAALFDSTILLKLGSPTTPVLLTLGFYEVGCHMALSPCPSITPLHFRSFLSPGFSSCHLPLQSLLSAFPPSQFLAVLQGRRHSGFTSSKKLSPVLLSLSSKQDQTQFSASVVTPCSPKVARRLLRRGQLLHDSQVSMATLSVWHGCNTEIPI